jgi:hypothetical protein
MKLVVNLEGNAQVVNLVISERIVILVVILNVKLNYAAYLKNIKMIILQG